MKTSFAARHSSRLTKFILIGWFFLVLMLLSTLVMAQSARDISQGIALRIDAASGNLNFPKSVERYYQARGFKLSWVATDKKNEHTETAMMLLDCVRQFGLNTSDYHPEELLYSKLKLLTNSSDLLDQQQRIHFDVLLTDAIITMMNHLHYGKFNPLLSQLKIDNGSLPHFNADFQLFKLIDLPNFYSALVKVQPSSAVYAALQNQMQLVLGQYILDSYEYPHANVRKMAINMERLRWLDHIKGNRIEINVPAYQLKLYANETVKSFKVVVGRKESPTQNYQSTLTSFTAAPEWKVSAEQFVATILPAALTDPNFLAQNRYSIFDSKQKRVNINSKKLLKISKNPTGYTLRQSPSEDNTLGKIFFEVHDVPNGALYDHRERKIFAAKDRAASRGSIQVENPELFAKLLLIADGAQDQVVVLENALNTYHYKNFELKKPLPIAVTYLTCEMIDSRLVLYKDIYEKDAALENLVFDQQQIRLAKKR